ncbi:MAG: hypothetical protein H0U74_17850 [Bradymonadaceae bacterium]|nr:hypothetical protein [Lujinxingiaceae bacterium]
MSENEQNPFARKAPTESRLQGLTDQGYIVVVTQAFGADGEDLIDHTGPRFSGEPGVKLRVKQGDVVEDVVLSPFYGDPSKLSDQPFVAGVACELFSPVSGAPLDKIPGMHIEGGGAFFAIYLTPKLKGGELVAINNIWGNTNSRMLSEKELLLLLADREGEEAGNEGF